MLYCTTSSTHTRQPHQHRFLFHTGVYRFLLFLPVAMNAVLTTRKVHFPVHNSSFRPTSTSFLVQNDVPPPGAYFRRSTLERDGRVCGSVSMKGYGSGFVSAAPRFRDVQTLQQAHLPGPGSYIVPSETGQEGGKLTSFSSLRRVKLRTNSATNDAIDLSERRLSHPDSGELVCSPLLASEQQGTH